MPSDVQYLVHTRLTRRTPHGDVVEVTSTDIVAFAVTSWKLEHPGISVGKLTVVAEDLDAFAEMPVASAEAAELLVRFLRWFTEAPTHAHELDNATSRPGSLTIEQFAALVPGTPVKFLVAGSWYRGEVHDKGITGPNSDPIVTVVYTGERAMNPKISKGSIEPRDVFSVYAGDVYLINAISGNAAPPRPTIHTVRDARVRVHSARPDTNEASDIYSLEISGVQIHVQLVAADDTNDEPNPEEPTVHVRIENIGHPKGTHLVVDINGNANDYRF